MLLANASSGDMLVLQFDSAVPQYELTVNPTGVHFAGGGGKGGTFTLAGRHGMRLNIANTDWTLAPGNQFPHGTDLTQSAPTLVEARQMGNYEGVVNIGLGLGRAVCPRVVTLFGPPRLVIDFSNG